jgi:lipoprotein-anchoring transpeptidase ErfK/SrfK
VWCGRYRPYNVQLKRATRKPQSGDSVNRHIAGGLAALGERRSGRRWLRGLLAASVAIAALIAVAEPADARYGRRYGVKRPAEKAEPASASIKGPLIIAISIGGQHLTVYDQGVAIAHSPISSGMAGHSTPMGVFSVIGKERYHRSNIYSGAPMPFMQRITWSGVALHAGALPGYPASHGCIRLPNEFAARLWGMTKLGARVIVARNDVTPVAISHARLAALHVPVTASAQDKRADALRPSLDADGGTAPVVKPVRTAEASDAAVASDAAQPQPSSVPEAATSPAAAAAPTKTPDTAEVQKPVEPAQTAAQPTAAQTSDHPGSVPEAAAEAQGTGSTLAEPIKTPDAAVQAAEPAPAQAQPAPTPSAGTPAVGPETAAEAHDKTPPATDTTGAIDLALPAAAPAVAAPASVSVEPATPAATPAPDESTGVAALPSEEVFVPPDRPARPLRAGPVTVFVSRKDGRLYVRKRFDPLFSVPIAIKADRPIGTHVFTAAEGEAGALSWIVVSLPAELPRGAGSAAKSDRHRGVKADAGRGKPAEPAIMTPSTAAEALDRLDIPAEVTDQIAGLMSPGASLIVSDQGLGDETGLETDFIVLSR